MEKMNQEYKEPWLIALRSNDFTQGFHFLNSNNKFCCLGVLCEINEVRKIDRGVNNLILNLNVVSYADSVFASEISLPHSFREKVGISKDAIVNLQKMNDIYGNTFPEIADWIEKNL